MVIALLPFVLSLWQVLRGVEKASWEDALAASQTRPPQIMQSLPADAAPGWQSVRLGRAAPLGEPVLLDNSLLEGKPGYRVLQPAALADGSRVLLDLGWLAEGRPVPPWRPGRDVSGLWQPWHERFVLGGARVGAAGVVDRLDRQALMARWPGVWRAGVVALNPQAGMTVWPEEPPLSSVRHYGYALQWALLGLCLCWQARRYGKEREHES